MKTLTPDQARELEECLPEHDTQEVEGYEVDSELLIAGYVYHTVVDRDDVKMHMWETTPRGQLALRCYRAYLATRAS